MSDLRGYTSHQAKTTTIRIFEDDDKRRFDDLQRQLTVAGGGVPFSQAHVVRYLLDLAEKSRKGE